MIYASAAKRALCPGVQTGRSRKEPRNGHLRPARPPRRRPGDRSAHETSTGEAIPDGWRRERLLNRGVTVAGYATRHDHAREFAGKYAGQGVSIHQGTVGRDEDVLRVFDEVPGRHGHVGILVNNAGITIVKTVRKMDPREWDHVRR